MEVDDNDDRCLASVGLGRLRSPRFWRLFGNDFAC
jgi:hypothetical protein